MTKSQNTKNEQLTEQWKKGELPSGWYWVDYYSVDGEVMLEYIPQHNGFGYEEKELVQAVLAEVPDYNEWKAKDDALTALLVEYGKLTKELQDEKEKHMTRSSLRSPADELVIEKKVWESTLNRSMVLEAENAQLKELLKELRMSVMFDKGLTDKIDEVLNV